MQRINIDVFFWSFSFLFFSIPLSLLMLDVYSLWHWSQPESLYFLMGSLVYLVGCFGVTAIGNVPLNNALARTDPNVDNVVEVWQNYLVRWTRWNHVRTAACIIASILIISVNFIS